MSATLGALLAFLAARFVIGSWVQERYAARLVKFNAEMRRSGQRYLLTVRLVPVFPFFLINLLAGLTKIDTWTFVWTTFVGIIPGSAVLAFAGRELGSIERAADLFSPGVMLAFGLLIALSLLPLVREWWVRSTAPTRKRR
ncbi:MAG: VTT domain-containing protein [Nitrosarchaeum sp.]|nr:VTT domain-containing protein [Nitrosarchaeum sp.]